MERERRAGGVPIDDETWRQIRTWPTRWASDA